MTQFDDAQKFRPAEKLGWREVDGETFIITTGGAPMIHALNGVGVDIWRMIEKRMSVFEMTDEIEKTYDVERFRAREDLEEFLAALKQKSMIEPA